MLSGRWEERSVAGRKKDQRDGSGGKNTEAGGFFCSLCVLPLQKFVHCFLD